MVSVYHLRKTTYIESKYSRIFYICFGVGYLVVKLGRNKTCLRKQNLVDCVYKWSRKRVYRIIENYYHTKVSTWRSNLSAFYMDLEYLSNPGTWTQGLVGLNLWGNTTSFSSVIKIRKFSPKLQIRGYLYIAGRAAVPAGVTVSEVKALPAQGWRCFPFVPAAARAAQVPVSVSGIRYDRAARKLQSLGLKNHLNLCTLGTASSGRKERSPPSCRKGQHFSLYKGDDSTESLNVGQSVLSLSLRSLPVWSCFVNQKDLMLRSTGRSTVTA